MTQRSRSWEAPGPESGTENERARGHCHRFDFAYEPEFKGWLTAPEDMM